MKNSPIPFPFLSHRPFGFRPSLPYFTPKNGLFYPQEAPFYLLKHLFLHLKSVFRLFPLQMRKRCQIVRHFLFFLFLLGFTSCSSLRYAGVDRIARFEVSSPDVTDELDGYRIAFASDFHLPSRFRERQLQGAVKALNALQPDLVLLGGDYQEACDYVDTLFAALGQCRPTDGIWAVMGNNDFERCADIIVLAMRRNGIHLLDYDTVTIRPGLVVAGVPFCTHPPLVEPVTNALNPEDFVVLFTHSPDIAEALPLTPDRVDLTLAGHTHGGQITFFYLFAPETASRYGQKFLAGRRTNSRGVPVITSRGLGTSRIPVRFCAPTDIVFVTLAKPKNAKMPISSGKMRGK